MSDFFTQHELEQASKLPDNVLPTKNDCLKFVIYHGKKSKEQHKTIARSLAQHLEKTWNNADCCPFTNKRIYELFETEIWQKYKYLQREKALPGCTVPMKRSHKKKNISKQLR